MEFFWSVWLFIKISFWFSWHQVVKDVIPEPPQKMISVSWKNIHANLGNRVTPTQMRYQPNVNWPVESKQFYTIMLVDPDAPSRSNSTLKNILHWLSVNIPETHISKGETVAEYIGSAAPKGSGLHRYTFLAFRQPKFQSVCIPYLSNSTVNGRLFFNVSSYVQTYSLKLVAGNFVRAEWDEYVPILNEQLGI